MSIKPTESALSRFCRLPTPSHEKVYSDANRILDDIISQCHSYHKPNQVDNPKDLVQFISHGCEILQNATILLRSKFVQVVNINLPQIKNSLDERCVNNLVTFLCETLSNSKSPLVLEFMKALALTLVGNGCYLSEDSLLLLLAEDGIIWMYVDHQDWIIRGYALQCLGNICLRSANKNAVEKEYIQLCYSKLLDTLRKLLSGDHEDFENYKLINVTLKGLQNVLSSVVTGDGVVEPEFAVALLQAFLAFGTAGFPNNMRKLIKFLPTRKAEDIDSPDKIYPTRRKEKSPMTKKVHAKKSRRRKKKNVSVTLEESFDSVSEDSFSTPCNSFESNWRKPIQLSSSSESEFSDSELGNQDKLNSALSKVRQNAAVTIQDVLRCCDRRLKFSCWLRLVPESISNDDPSLLSSLATEHLAKVRAAVLLALMELIDGSKGFLDSAVDATTRTIAAGSFTTFSMKLSQSIHILHDTLLMTLQREQTDASKDRVIKCLTLLMLNTPYRKTAVDYLPDIVVAVAKHVLCQETSLCQSVVTCLAASMSALPDNKIVLKLLACNEMPSKSVLLHRSGDADEEIKEVQSWLVGHCLKELSSAAKDSPRELRLASEYIQLVTVILRCHPRLVTKSQRSKFIDLLVNVFMFSTDPTVSVHAIKLLEEFSKYFAIMYEKTKDDVEGCEFWRKMLTGAIPHFLNGQNEKPVKCQAAICDWVSNLGSHFFSSMKNPEQIFIKTILIGLAASNEQVLAAAAVRALGVIIDYPCMKDDVWFVVDVTRSIVNQLNNPSVSIRLKAAWSLANLCDFIGKNGFLTQEYPETLILSILQNATKAALDNERVTSNGVRALGNILKFLPKDLFDKDSFQETIQNAVEALIKNILTGSMKTRWNACYACRYMFENTDCPIGKAPWTENLYNSLLEALRECKNFKVRTSAASALCSPLSRSCYGSEKFFSFLWKACLEALEKSEELTDFTEFKHKDTLQDQTSILLFHLLSLATAEDIVLLRLDVHKYHSVFVFYCERCIRKVETDEVDQSYAEDITKKDIKNIANTIEDEKIKELKVILANTKKNLCQVTIVDCDMLTIDVIKTALLLMT